jgi:benzoyl-CoA reductase subunit C
MDELGAQVVGDDLCTGSRFFSSLVNESAFVAPSTEPRSDPITALADYYLQRPLCPTKYHPGHDPGSYLLERVRQAQAEGVVFVPEKFCEPHTFTYAMVRPALDRAGMPHLLLEMEQTPSLEALRTRLQAFVEML